MDKDETVGLDYEREYYMVMDEMSKKLEYQKEEYEKEKISEQLGKIDRKLSSIFKEILMLESRLNAIENKKEVLKAKSIIEDNECKIQEIKFRSLAENRYIDDRMKEFNERW